MKLKKLHTLVEELYLAKHAGRDEWADWLYIHHVLWVANKCGEFCSRFGGDHEIAVAAALVHDIADAVMRREDKGHEQKSLQLGRDLCNQAGYAKDEIDIIIEDIALRHSCHDSVVPQSLEGKLMAAADACSHYQTDFYLYAFYGTNFGSYDERKVWAREKIERDYSQKIFHEEIRSEVHNEYEALKRLLNY